jgi:LPS sulfotransferase NodH
MDGLEIYFIAFTMRTGSNLLCDYLTSSGLGYPTEYFQYPAGIVNPGLFEALGVEGRDVSTYFQKVLLARSRNGLFGAKLSWDHKNVLEEELARHFPDPDRWGHILSRVRWVYSERRDKIDQAISLWRAQKTGRWMSSSQAAVGHPEYDCYGIFTRLFSILAMDYVWKDFFDRRRIQPFIVTYEDLVRSPRETLSGLYRFIKDEELTKPEDIVIESHLEVQRDHYTDELKQRFLEDIDHLGAPQFWADRPEQADHWRQFFSSNDWIPRSKGYSPPEPRNHESGALLPERFELDPDPGKADHPASPGTGSPCHTRR